jgi:uncharacterized protein (TIGR00369 family)
MSTDATVPESWGDPRSKTVTWYDPLTPARAGAQMSGLDYLRAMADGELPPPPIGLLMGFRLGNVEKGTVSFHCTPDESVYNPIGVIHGGLVCTLLDSVAGCAVQSLLPAGTGYTSIEIKVNYLRPVHAGMELVAKGWVTKPGQRVSFAEGDVRDGEGKILATASSTCLIFNGRPASAVSPNAVRQ